MYQTFEIDRLGNIREIKPTTQELFSFHFKFYFPNTPEPTLTEIQLTVIDMVFDSGVEINANLKYYIVKWFPEVRKDINFSE